MNITNGSGGLSIGYSSSYVTSACELYSLPSRFTRRSDDTVYTFTNKFDIIKGAWLPGGPRKAVSLPSRINRDLKCGQRRHTASYRHQLVISHRRRNLWAPVGLTAGFCVTGRLLRLCGKHYLFWCAYISRGLKGRIHPWHYSMQKELKTNFLVRQEWQRHNKEYFFFHPCSLNKDVCFWISMVGS